MLAILANCDIMVYMMKTRKHIALFHKDLPFKAKVEKNKTKYTRKAKHKKDIV